VENNLSYDLDGLAVDIFSVTESGAVVEPLTGAHGMTEMAASCQGTLCFGSCGCVCIAEA
jgi:hypothetical protein